VGTGDGTLDHRVLLR